MATLEYLSYTPEFIDVVGGNQVQWAQRPRIARPSGLPQIFWRTGDTWGEANCWALQMALAGERKRATIRDLMISLLSYANWLEKDDVKWWHFPQREADRCLNRYRGELTRARDAGALSPSTASKKMAVAIRFYRWVKSQGLLATEWPMWSERQIGIRINDAFGFSHTLRVATTNLAIKNRRPEGMFALEDGLLPVTQQTMAQILSLAEEHASEEIDLMLRTGFQTGLRLGSIADLKVQTILRASLDPVIGIYRLAVGPTAHPPVRTKFSKAGAALIPTTLLERLKRYIVSPRRLKREALAGQECKDLVFLTRFGKPFVNPETEIASPVNEAMSRLRKVARERGINCMNEFKFHRTRATFATELLKIALDQLPSKADAIRFVRQALMHKDDSTTLEYVHFLETTAAMSKVSAEFSEFFMGIGSANKF